jgi:hypothetical protein
MFWFGMYFQSISSYELIIFNILNWLNMLMVHLGNLKNLKQMITKFT